MRSSLEGMEAGVVLSSVGSPAAVSWAEDHRCSERARAPDSPENHSPSWRCTRGLVEGTVSGGDTGWVAATSPPQRCRVKDARRLPAGERWVFEVGTWVVSQS